MAHTTLLLTASLAAALVALGGCTDPETALKNHLAKSESLIAEGRYEQAGVELRNAMRIDPKGTEALFLAGRIGEENSNFQSALLHYRKVVEIDPKHLRAKARIAMFQVLGGAVDAAEQQSNEITALDPAFPGGQSVRAAVLLARGKRDAALAEGLKVLERFPAERDAVPLVAGIYAGSRDDKAARDVLLRAVEADPKLIPARNMLALTARRLSDNATAETQYREIVKLVPRSPAPRINLAVFLSGLDRLDEAEKVLRESIDADTQDSARVLTLVEFLGERRSAEAAEKELKAQIERNPKAFNLQLRLAGIDLAAGRIADAEKQLKAVIDKDSAGSSAALARAALIDLMLRANRRPEAEQLIEAALARNAGDSTALMWRARLALRDRRNTQAITDLRAVVRNMPDSPEVIDLLARAYRANDQLDLSIAAIQESIERYPLRADLRLVLAEHLMNARRFEDADRAVEAALKITPSSPRGLAIRIDIQQASGKPKDALAVATQMKAVAPQEPVGYLRAAQAQLVLNRPDLAAKEYDEAVRRFPASEEVLRAWAGFASSQNRLDSVAARLDDMVKAQPRFALLHLLRGEALAALRRTEPAEAALNEALRLDPRILVAYTDLAGLYSATGRLPKAVAVLEAGLKVLPGDTVLTITLAEAQRSGGNVEAAMAILQGLLKVDPRNDIVANNLAALISDISTDPRQLAYAVSLAERFKDSTNPYFLDTLGWLYYQQGNFAQAVPLLSSAAKFAPGIPAIRYHLGMALLKSGDVKAAQVQLREAISAKVEFAGIEEARRALAGS